jgi:hypothetical protein
LTAIEQTRDYRSRSLPADGISAAANMIRIGDVGTSLWQLAREATPFLRSLQSAGVAVLATRFTVARFFVIIVVRLPETDEPYELNVFSWHETDQPGRLDDVR